jgi:hypothetical protein
MNTRAKGNRIRRKAIDMLTEDGFNIAIIERTGRFIFPKDAYGLFDLLALSSEDRKPILFQITANKPHSHKALTKFAKEYKSIGVCQLVWTDGKGFHNYIYGADKPVKVKLYFDGTWKDED